MTSIFAEDPVDTDRGTHAVYDRTACSAAMSLSTFDIARSMRPIVGALPGEDAGERPIVDASTGEGTGERPIDDASPGDDCSCDGGNRDLFCPHHGCPECGTRGGLGPGHDCDRCGAPGCPANAVCPDDGDECQREGCAYLRWAASEARS